MTPVPQPLMAELAEAVAAERGAYRSLRNARALLARLLRCLREEGVPLTHPGITRILGEEPSLEVRRRLAARLRQRRRVIVPHANQDLVAPQQPAAALPLGERKEPTVAETTKLVRRTITEEYAPDPDAEVEDDLEDEDDEESEDDDEPKKRRR